MLFCIQNSVFSIRIASLYGSQPSSVVFFCIHNSVIMTRINSLYGSQTSPVVACMQNNEINIRITSLYGSKPSSVVFACKTATLWPELQVSMGPSPHLLFFFAFTTASLWPGLIVSMGHRSHLSLCACKTTRLAPEYKCKTAPLGQELQVSMSPSPHLRFFQAKPRLLDQKYKSLWVPDHTCRFVHAKLRD